MASFYFIFEAKVGCNAIEGLFVYCIKKGNRMKGEEKCGEKTRGYNGNCGGPFRKSGCGVYY